MVYSEICHKNIHIMVWKEQTSKEIATCEKLDSLSSCCGQAAPGMLRAFPAHFVPLQSNSTHCNVHGSRATTENCMTCAISCETHCWRNHWEFTHFKQATWNLYTLHWNPAHFTVHRSYTIESRSLHISSTEQCVKYANNSVSFPITCCRGVLVHKGQYTEETTITKNISLWEGVLVLKGQYIHMSRENKKENSFEKIFHFGRVFWSWKANIQKKLQ